MRPAALSDAETRMKKGVDALRKDLAAVRTGRASPALVENVLIDYMGIPTPLKQLAAISVPEARLILLQPWDKGTITAIEKGILKSELGLNPSSDGTAIRIPIPPLSEERRRDMVRQVKKRVEDARIALRNIRRDANEHVKGAERNKELSQDQSKRLQEQLQRLTDTFIIEVDKVGADKEKELLEV